MKKKIVLSKHTKKQLALRKIAEDVVWEGLKSNPFKIEDSLTVYHLVTEEGGKQCLIRIFVNEIVNPNLIVTVYKTSKLNKYL